MHKEGQVKDPSIGPLSFAASNSQVLPARVHVFNLGLEQLKLQRLPTGSTQSVARSIHSSRSKVQGTCKIYQHTVRKLSFQLAGHLARL